MENNKDTSYLENMKVDNDNIAYSLFLEESHNKNSSTNSLEHPLPRRKYKWVDDNTVANCYGCNTLFNIMRRKHHCRFCGNIFCYTCINHSSIIPDDLISDDSKKGSWNEYLSGIVYYKDPTKHKVCVSCKSLIEYINSVKKLIEVFIILKLDIIDLAKAKKISPAWNYASNYILSILREIQYKLPLDSYTNFDKLILKNNVKYLNGHNKYIVNYIKICKTDEDFKNVYSMLESSKKINCFSMMCSRNCSQTLTSFDVINIILYFSRNNINNPNIIKYILKYFQCDDKEFKCYLPILIYYLKHDNSNIIASYILERCQNSIELLNLLYGELRLFPKNSYHREIYGFMVERLKEIFASEPGSEKHSKIKEGYNFINMLTLIYNAICNDNKKFDEIKEEFFIRECMYYPFNYDKKIKLIHLKKIQMKNSATKPLFIPCELEDGSVVNLLYKKENVKQDQTIMNLIYLANEIIKQEENIDIKIVTYNILPIGDDSGLIEIIDDSSTIYHIEQKLNLSILNYILENNENKTIKEIRSNFIKSTALYCVVSYLFGIGDRHLENIMITNDGRLFHIDFGYILGDDPIINDPGIRITPSMIDAIGGFKSKYYHEFVELCTIIFNCLRRHVNLFTDILLTLPNIAKIGKTHQQIYDFLITKFIPGENNIDAMIHISNQIDRQNYIDGIKDWCHYHSKEKTVSGAFNMITKSLSSLVYQEQLSNNESSILDNKI